MTQRYTNILLLTLPLILSNLSIPVVGIADTAVAGHFLGISAIASIGLGSLVFDVLYWSFGFLKLATSGLVAQNLGRQDFSQINIVFYRHLFFALLLATGIILFKPIIVKISMHFLNPDLSIRSLAEPYISTRLYSAPAVFINYVLLGYLIANQKMSTVFAYTLIVNLSNVILNILCVTVFQLGITGIAIASVCSQYLGGIFAFIIIFNKNRKNRPQWTFTVNELFNRQQLIDIFKTNTNIFIRTITMLFVFLYVARQGAMLGTVILASNIILLHFQSTMAYALDAFSDVAEALSGKAYGAKNIPLLKDTVNKVFVCMSIYAVIASMLFAFFQIPLISIFTHDALLIESVQQYFPWIVASPIISYVCFLFDGVFIGTLHTREMRNSMIISCLFFLIVCHLFVTSYGNHGLWLAILSFMFMRGLTLFTFYKWRVIKA